MKGEWWVMRVVMSAEEIARIGGVTDRLLADVRKRAPEKDLLYINGDVVEPIEVYDDDQQAAMRRAVKEHERTGCVHKIVLNAEL